MKCSRQGRAHNTESGGLVCVCPRSLESPLGVGGDERERECGNCALFPAPGGLRDLVSSSLGLGSRSVTLSYLELSYPKITLAHQIGWFTRWPNHLEQSPRCK